MTVCLVCEGVQGGVRQRPATILQWMKAGDKTALGRAANGVYPQHVPVHATHKAILCYVKALKLIDGDFILLHDVHSKVPLFLILIVAYLFSSLAPAISS